jgi:hypothetical protein
MAIAAFLYVDKPVSTLQFDLDTEGTVTSVVAPSAQKSLSTNRLPDGKLRVLIFGLNQNTFSGRIATVDKSVNSITNVTGATPDGTDANAHVTKISGVKGVVVSIKK